jgi:predicted site-specific integrase-resolvase
MKQHLSAQAVAQLLGIKTATLAKWRREGRGPAGWFKVSATLVVYPVEGIELFLKQKRMAFH